jgi:hypothetical protein
MSLLLPLPTVGAAPIQETTQTINSTVSTAVKIVADLAPAETGRRTKKKTLLSLIGAPLSLQSDWRTNET